MNIDVPSSRENFLLMMQGQRPRRMPLDLTVTPPVLDLIEAKTGIRDAVRAFDTDFQEVGYSFGSDPEKWRAAYESLGFAVPADASISDIGVPYIRPPDGSTGNAYHLSAMLHPLSVIEEAAQLEKLPWPDLTNPAGSEGLEVRIREIAAAGKVSVAAMECTVFEIAWYLRGMDNLFGDLIEENGMGDWLLDWFMERSVRTARLMVRAGVDVIALGDDVGTQRGMMMSVPFWRQHLKPRLKRVIDTVRETESRHTFIRYHSDGDIRLIIDDLVEIGVDFLNPVQPECMPLAEVVHAHQHHLAFWGMVGTQTTMPFGSTDEVRAIVAECGELARGGARLVVAPTHVLEPDVPWANILALVDAVKSTGLC